MSRPDVSTVTEMFSGLYDVLDAMPWNGLAPTYKARKGDDIVVLALLPVDTENSPEASAVIRARARALIGLDHPRLLPVLAEGVRYGVPYLELAYVEGDTLDHLVAGGPLQRDRALTITRRVLQALELLEAVNIRHLDLTPSNILVADVDQVKVMGTGVAAILREVRDSDKTGPTGKGSGPSAGRFLAPELLVGDKVDQRSDIYGAGALMHFMLTGQPLGKEASPPPDDLRKIIGRATARTRDGRYTRAAAMRAAIEATGAPVTLLPPPLPGQDPRKPGKPAYEVPARKPTAGSLPATPMRDDSPSPRRKLVLGAAVLVVIAAVATAVIVNVAPEPSTEALATSSEASATPIAEAPEAAGTNEATPPPVPAADPEGAPDGPPTDAATAGDGTVASGDLLAGELPAPLDALRDRVAAGEELSRSEQHLVERFAYQNRDDPRPHLLLARDYMARGWSSDAVSEYREAHRLDPETVVDAQMERDLVSLARRAGSGPAAAQAIVRIYGERALPAVEAALEAENSTGERRRLQRLQQRLVALTAN